jgi:hypothetical protein
VLDPPLDLLDHLVGTGELTGQMGETSQREAVEAQWGLDGVWMKSGRSRRRRAARSTLTEPTDRQPYEAIYFIGFGEQDE